MHNIWVAAAEGDLARVQDLVEHHGTSSRISSNTVITLDWRRFALLRSPGGDVNVTDEDGDTPLYTVEDVDTARWLIDRGARVDHRNHAGLSPIEHLADDYPDVAAFLRSTTE